VARNRSTDRAEENEGEPSRARRLLSTGWRGIFGLVAALGLLGAIGGWVVNQYAGSTVEKITRASAITATPMLDDDAYSDGFGLVMSRPPKEGAFASVHDCSTLLTATRSAGGVHISPLLIKLLLEGRTVHDVTVVGMHAKLVNRTAPLHGTYVGCAGAGEIDPLRINFNLDRDNPVAERLTEEGADKGPYFGEGHVVNLKKSEVAPVLITATTKQNHVKWELQIDAIVDGHQREFTVTNHGQPFDVTAPLCGKRVYAPEYEWDWATTHRLIKHARGSYYC
jgi:hypothetical protein